MDEEAAYVSISTRLLECAAAVSVRRNVLPIVEKRQINAYGPRLAIERVGYAKPANTHVRKAILFPIRDVSYCPYSGQRCRDGPTAPPWRTGSKLIFLGPIIFVECA